MGAVSCSGSDWAYIASDCLGCSDFGDKAISRLSKLNCLSREGLLNCVSDSVVSDAIFRGGDLVDVASHDPIIGRDVLCCALLHILSKMFSSDLLVFRFGCFRRTLIWERYLSVEKELSSDLVGFSPFGVCAFNAFVVLPSSVAPVMPET